MSTFAAYDPGPGRRRPAQPAPTIRDATAADVPACAELIVSRTGGDPAARAGRLRRDLGNPDRYQVVAESERGIVGYGAAILHSPAPLAAPDVAPAGYYLIALIVAAHSRRRGIGELLTVRRMHWIQQRADEAWYFANVANGATIDLHRRHGFEEVTRKFSFPGAPLRPGTGVLLRARLS